VTASNVFAHASCRFHARRARAGKVAGIDVHKKVLMVVVIDADTPAAKPERRRFTTMPSELCRLSTWLKEYGVEEAVMESTAQYWRPVWLELEPHIRLHLAQAFSNRAPRGRKHDFKDAERLVRRLIAQELILSFVPDGEQRIWRNLTRMKLQLVAKTNEQFPTACSQPAPANGLPDRPVYQEEHAAQLIMARRICSPHKGRIHLRRSVDRPFAFRLQSCGGPYICGNLITQWSTNLNLKALDHPHEYGVIAKRLKWSPPVVAAELNRKGPRASYHVDRFHLGPAR
jgi:hypothetical protein